MLALLLLSMLAATCYGERVTEWLEDDRGHVSSRVSSHGHFDLSTFLDDACELCSLGEPDAPRLIVRGMEESGLGGNGMELIMGLDLAFKAGLQFGGVLYTGPLVQHGVHIVHTLAETLNIGHPRRLFRRSLPASTYMIPSVSSHEEFSHHLAQSGSRTRWVFYNGSALHLQKMTSGIAQFTNGPHIFERLKAHALPGLTSLVHGVDHNRPQVVMHVRRGDVSAVGPTSFMYLPMSYFVDMVGHVKKQLPNAQFHTFSTSEGRWGASDFEDLTKIGAELHLDDSTLNSLAHFATSTVFIGSRSTMSEFASVLRRGCTIDYGHALMFTNWINGSNAHKASFDEELHECIHKV